MEFLLKKIQIWVKWVVQYVYAYRKQVLIVAVFSLIAFSFYVGLLFFEQKQTKEEEEKIYQLQQALYQIEKKNEGNILDRSANMFSKKRVKDFSLIQTVANQYLNFLKSVQKPKSQHWVAAIELAYFFIQYQMHSTALELLETISSKDSNNTWLHHLGILQLGSLFLKEKNYTRAVHLFSLILSSSDAKPFHSEALFKTAMAYNALGEVNKAKEIYSMILENSDGILYKERAKDYDRLLKVQQKIKQKD